MAEFKKEGTRWYGKVAGGTEWEYIGSVTSYAGGNTDANGNPVKNVGLYQPQSRLSDLVFRSDEWDQVVGHWAHVMIPTANAESVCRFDRINTYDNVNFTFGFLQLAAHTENDNFALIMRQFLKDPNLKGWFSDLVIHNDRIHQKLADGSLRNLEKAPAGAGGRSRYFMEYLNASRLTIDENEKINALKMIHLTNKSAKARELQVVASVDACRRKVGYWPQAFADVVPDTIFSLVLSQLHWRGGTDAATLRSLQNQANPEKAILDFIKGKDANRGTSVEKGLNDAKRNGWLGGKSYHKADKEFR
jgi:hypothetical protein